MVINSRLKIHSGFFPFNWNTNNRSFEFLVFEYSRCNKSNIPRGITMIGKRGLTTGRVRRKRVLYFWDSINRRGTLNKNGSNIGAEVGKENRPQVNEVLSRADGRYFLTLRFLNIYICGGGEGSK